MSMPQMLNLLGQILDGLEHLHRCGVYHSDLKAGNIMVCETGEDAWTLKVSGWGGAHMQGRRGRQGRQSTA
jgi:serine/threonine protein kinase